MYPTFLPRIFAPMGHVLGALFIFLDLAQLPPLPGSLPHSQQPEHSSPSLFGYLTLASFQHFSSVRVKNVLLAGTMCYHDWIQ
jgi:hypothetical protein